MLIEAAHAIASQNNRLSKSTYLLDESKNPNNMSMSYCTFSNIVEPDSVVEVGFESSNRLDKNDALVSGCVEMINNPLHNKPTQRSYCDCQCSLLAADLEGIKLEITIMQKDIKTNASKSRADEVNRLKIELSSEREKCERLEADLSFIIEGRTREVSEMNDIIASLECKLKTTEATNDSLRQLIITIISKSKPNEILPSNVPAMGDTQCLPSLEEQINYDLIHDPDAQIIKGRTREVNEINVINASLECNPEATEATNDSLRELISIKIPNPKPNEISPSNSPTTSNSLLSSHVELTNYDPKHVSPVKTSHGDQHKKVDSNAKKSTNIIDHNLPLLDNKRFNPTSPPLKVNLQRSEQQNGQIRRNYFRKRLRKRSRARLSQERDRDNYYYQTSTKTGQNNKVPWFRYHIQRKDPDWIEHLDLVRRITVSQ